MDIKTYGWRTIALDIYVISLFCALLLFVRSVHKTYKYGEYNESFPIRVCLTNNCRHMKDGDDIAARCGS